MKVKKNSIVIKIIICIVLTVGIIITYRHFDKKLDIELFQRHTEYEDINIINDIEKMDTKDGLIELDGYAFKIGINSEDTLISVFLKEIEEDVDKPNTIWFNMEYTDKEYVNNKYKEEKDYLHSGFLASLEEDKLNKDAIYEVMVRLRTEVKSTDEEGKETVVKTNNAVSSNFYLHQGKLLDYNPKVFKSPNLDVKSNLLKNVFIDGDLRFYDGDIGLYVYQYDGKLYWIADENFKWDEDETTYIIYHLRTNQVDKLPEERIQYAFDNLDFYFETIEYKDEDTSPYRMAFKEIPVDYAITYVNTGHYDTEVSKSHWTKPFHIKISK